MNSTFDPKDQLLMLIDLWNSNAAITCTEERIASVDSAIKAIDECRKRVKLIHEAKYAIHIKGGVWAVATYDAGAESFKTDHGNWFELIELDDYLWLEGEEEPEPDDITPEDDHKANLAFESRCEKLGINLIDY